MLPVTYLFLNCRRQVVLMLTLVKMFVIVDRGSTATVFFNCEKKKHKSTSACLSGLHPCTHISVISHLSRGQGGQAAGVEELDQGACWDLGAHPE